MHIACEFCKTKKRNRSALEMHQRAKHPKELRAKIQEATRVSRRWRLHPFLAGMLGGIVGVVLLAGGIVAAAVQSKAVEVTPQGVVTLKPWVVTVDVKAKR